MLRNYLRFLVLAASVFGTVAAHAVCYVYESTGKTYGSQQAACDAFAASESARFGVTLVGKLSPGTTLCRAVHEGSGNDLGNTNINQKDCPLDEDKCKGLKGRAGVTNWTMGYQRTPSINSKEPFIAPNNPTGKSACVDSCKVEIDSSAPCPGCRAYVSQFANSEGLYRVSTEFVSMQTGELCQVTPLDNPVKPSDSVDAKCPGYVGEVNGIKGCYGTASKPVTTSPNIVPSNFEQLPGNPAAGALSGPPTPGSLATPTAGTGGSAGGPSGAATVGGSGSSGAGGNGSGSSVTSQGNGTGRVGTQSGTEQQNCGAPGQPVCDVKLDEKETKKEGDFTAATKALDDQEKDAKSAFDRAHAIQQPMWTFAFQFPTGCAPFDTGIRGFSLNPCRYQSTIHDLMSMIWAAVTLFCIIGMVGRTIREA